MTLDARGLVCLLFLAGLVLVAWPLVEHFREQRAWRRRMAGRRAWATYDDAQRERLLRERIRQVLAAGGFFLK